MYKELGELAETDAAFLYFGIARRNRLLDYESSYRLIQSEIRRSLRVEDQNHGYIYVREVVGNDYYVKTGYTSSSPEERSEEWAFDCNRTIRFLYPTRF